MPAILQWLMKPLTRKKVKHEVDIIQEDKNMKRYIIMFWHGLTGILSSIAEWFTVVLGMKDDSKYGKVIRRTVGTCFATIMLLITAAVVWDFGRTACNRLNWSSSDYIPSYNWQNSLQSSELEQQRLYPIV